MHLISSMSNRAAWSLTRSELGSLFVYMVIGALMLGLISSPAVAQPSFGDQMVSSPPDASAPPVSVSAQLSQESAAPGSQLIIAVVLSHKEHYHTNLHEPIVPKEMGDFTPVATDVTWPEIAGVEFGGVQWPEPKKVGVDFLFTGNPIEYLVYSDQAVIYIPVTLAPDMELGVRDIELQVRYQACNDTVCFPPTSETLTVSVEVVESVESSVVLPVVFDGYNPEKIEQASNNETDQAVQIERRFLGMFVIPPVDSAAGIIVLALSAAFGGFILNLTPCVLPVIPIKVMTISQHAGEKRGKAFMLSMWMALGVIAFWVGIGIPVAFVADFVDPSIIFGVWWITGIIGLVILFMGVGIMGLFQINLPQKVYMVNPKADSAYGSFVFGIMTAVLGLPCFGFVAGALLAGAATMPPMLVLTVFAFMGVGMALPYVVLAMFPSLINKIPRTGPASELVKQVMGLLMIAAGAYFLGTTVISFGSSRSWEFPWWGKSVHWWVIGLVGLSTGLWLIIQTIRISKRLAPRVVFTLIGLFVAASGGGIAYNQTMHYYHNFWQPFSVELLTASLDNGQVVVLDFTAEWCVNCKALEATILSRNPVKPELLSSDVVPMVADLTSLSAPGWEYLNDELGQTGIPFLVVFAPGSDEPVWLSNAYTSSQVVDAINLAREQGERVSMSD
jgi:suppressor for copper-sensitivity B